MAAELVLATATRPTARATTRVMGCDASVVVTAADAAGAGELARRAVERCGQLELRWSRFLADSEISGLNAASGEARRVSADTVRLVEALVRGWLATDGAFDPTLLGALVGLGYATSRDDATLRTSLAGDIVPQGRPDEILVDPVAGVVRLPAGTTLDPGGLGKGLAADLVTAELLADGATGALVEIGGDLRVRGIPPDSDRWAIRIRPTHPGEPDRVVELVDGAVATSSSRLRTWVWNGQERHHLVDPRTLDSTTTDVVACTVIAGTGAWSEAFTKVAFAAGVDDALLTYTTRSLAASITTADGTHHTTDSWEDFVR